MKTFITQPTYLPWLGIFKAIDYCDNFVFYDDVQFEKQSWQQRNRIINISNNGKPFVYLNVPVGEHSLETKIKDIKIKDKNFYKKHLDLVRINYKGAPFLDEVLDVLEQVYCNNYEYLADLNIKLIMVLSDYIGLKTNFVRSKKLNINGNRNERLINICTLFKTDVYLSPVGSKDYLDDTQFLSHGLKIEFLDFVHPVYLQSKIPFFSHLSIIDILVNIGPKDVRLLIDNIELV